MLTAKKTSKNNNPLVSYVDQNIGDVEFLIYLNACINLWEEIKPQNEAMYVIITTICSKYNITPEELLKGKKATAIPRRLMFYMIKKILKDLSFETVANMFGKQRSAVFNFYTEVNNMVKNKEKDTLLHIAAIRKNYRKYVQEKAQKAEHRSVQEYVNHFIFDQEFNIYLSSCLNKWKDIKPQCLIMDVIMNTICDNYKINANDLIYGKKHGVPRSIMLYMIKTTLKNLSFETLSDIFEREKSFIFKSYAEAEFMVERHKKKDAILLVLTIKNNLKSKNLLTEEVSNN